jgi:hypothetical protein
LGNNIFKFILQGIDEYSNTLADKTSHIQLEAIEANHFE